MNIPKMDYVIVTKNDIDTIDATIESIRKQPNVNRVIVIASESCSDGTLDKMRNLYLSNVGINVLITENIGLAYARKLGIREVVTDWFVFVDADVVLSNTWMKEMHEWLLHNNDQLLGALYGYLYRNEEQKEYLLKHSTVKNQKARMFTHNTIVKTILVSDWEPDEDVNAYEDYLLTQHIINKNYQCLNVPVVSHHDHRGSIWKEAMWGGAGAKISGYYTKLRQPVKYMVGIIYGGFKRTLKTRKKSFIRFGILKRVGTLWGYLRANKYRKKEY